MNYDTAVNRLPRILVFLVFPALVTIGTGGPFEATAGQSDLNAVPSPVSAEAALSLFQADPGLKVDLVAAEPLTSDPCAVTWDAEGRLYVVENRGYPTGSKDGKPLGVIARLEDSNGDGRMDQRVVFADGLTFPNGITPWNNGFIVTCAPDILFLQDTNRDGKADVRRVLLTGFDTSGSTQLRVAHPTFGPDGWIYLTSGLTRAGMIACPGNPERPAVRIGSDSRFNPFTLEIEAVDGRGQFGQTFDDWGNRFHCMNRIHIQHTVLPSRFLRRNPRYAFSDTVQNVPASMVDDLLKAKNLAARIYPISDNITTADSHAGTFSAACAVHVYRGDGLPADYYGDVFACDPTGNLVHRDRLTPDGPTFSSRMVNEGREFFASRDNWFRPVFLATGPDGGLYVCDMYRKTIEHPDYLPVEVRKRTDFESGKAMGRIWRITTAQPSARDSAREEARTREDRGSSKRRSLVSLSEEALVRMLGDPNVWQRETARRLLIERRATNAVAALLERLPALNVSDSTKAILNAPRHAADNPGAGPAVERVQELNALVVLSGWSGSSRNDNNGPHERSAVVPGAANGGVLRRLLRASVDASPGVRLTAWRWLSLVPSPGPEMADAVMSHWAGDPNPAVRFQIALALGNWKGGATLPGLVRIALKDGADRWTRAAVLSGLKGREQEFFDLLSASTASKPAPELMSELGRYLAGLDLGRMKAIAAKTSFKAGKTVDWPGQLAFWSGAVAAIRQSGVLKGDADALTRLGFTTEAQDRMARQAAVVLDDTHQSLAVKEAAARLLFAVPKPESIRSLEATLGPGRSPELQSTVLSLLAAWPDASVAGAWLAPEHWASLSPHHRDLLLAGLLSRRETIAVLLSAIEEGKLAPNALSLAQRDRLRNHQDPNILTRAGTLFAEAGNDRMKVYEAWKSAATLEGSARHGRELFKQQCASCHRLEREGANVGPDLFGIRNQTKESILLHILAPNYEVAAGFNAYQIETKDNRSLTGLIISETESSVTLRQAQGLEETLNRTDIVSLRGGAVSLMPEGFEQTLSRQDLADLLSFLKGE
jgi:putative membrane-bound dehydrogenase-like protein